MFSLESMIPKVCELAQEMGDDERARNLQCAVLQVLSSMVQFSFRRFIVGPLFYSNLVNIISPEKGELPSKIPNGYIPNYCHIQGMDQF